MKFSKEKALPLFEKPALANNSSSLLFLQIVPSLWVSMRYQKARHVQYSMTEEKGDFEHFSGNASTPHLNPRLHIEKKGKEINEFCVQYNFTRVKYTASRDVFPEKKLTFQVLYASSKVYFTNCDVMNGDLKPKRTRNHVITTALIT